MRKNFTNEIEVWFHNTKSSSTKFKVYNQFTLKVQHKRVTEGPELVVSFDGTTKVFKQSITDNPDFDTSKYNPNNCNGTIYRYDKKPDAVKQQMETLFPVLSNPLKKEFNTEPDETVIENRYIPYLKQLEWFYKNYINTAAFNKLIHISEDGFYKVPNNKVYHTSEDSNKSQFLVKPSIQCTVAKLIKYIDCSPKIYICSSYLKVTKTFTCR
jgi:hypothetical protein